MISSLFALLATTENPAAEAVLGEVLRVGSPQEKAAAAESLLSRGVSSSGAQLIRAITDLPDDLIDRLVNQSDRLLSAVERCCRSSDEKARCGAAHFIGLCGSQKNAHRLVNLLPPMIACRSPRVFNVSAESILRLADAVAAQFQTLRELADESETEATAAWTQLRKMVRGLSSAIARGLDHPRGTDSTPLAHALILITPWLDPSDRLLESLRRQTTPWPAVNRQLSRQAILAEASLLTTLICPTRERLRSNTVRSRDTKLQLRKILAANTHRLADPALEGLVQHCELATDVGTDLKRLRWQHAAGQCTAEVTGRLLDSSAEPIEAMRAIQLLAAQTRVDHLARLAGGTHGRLARMATRALARQARSGDTAASRSLLTTAHPRVASAGKIVSDAFKQLWSRYFALPQERRGTAVRALRKIHDACDDLLLARIDSPRSNDRLQAMQMLADAGVLAVAAEPILDHCTDACDRVRSKAVRLLPRLIDEADPEFAKRASDQLAGALGDPSDRVRADAVESLAELSEPTDSAMDVAFDPYVQQLLVARSRLGAARERANATLALSRNSTTAAEGSHRLLDLLSSPAAGHRLSGLWTLEQIADGPTTPADDVVRAATNLLRGDVDPRVREGARRALNRLPRARIVQAQIQPTRPKVAA